MSQPQPDLAQRATNTDLVRRSFALDEFEFRDNPDTGGWTFEGVASVVNHAYPVRDRWGVYMETIQAGAFDRTLNDQKAHVALYVNHRHDDLALSTRDAHRPLTLTADPHLRVIADLNPKRPDVQNVRYGIEDGILREMSIGFSPVPARDKWNDGHTEVTRTQVTLREVSIVERGANTGGTEAKMRAFDDFLDSLTDVDMDEAELRRAIAWLETRLPVTPAEEIIEPTEDPLAELRSRIERHRRDRLPLIAA